MATHLSILNIKLGQGYFSNANITGLEEVSKSSTVPLETLSEYSKIVLEDFEYCDYMTGLKSLSKMELEALQTVAKNKEALFSQGGSQWVLSALEKASVEMVNLVSTQMPSLIAEDQKSSLSVYELVQPLKEFLKSEGDKTMASWELAETILTSIKDSYRFSLLPYLAKMSKETIKAVAENKEALFTNNSLYSNRTLQALENASIEGVNFLAKQMPLFKGRFSKWEIESLLDKLKEKLGGNSLDFNVLSKVIKIICRGPTYQKRDFILKCFDAKPHHFSALKHFLGGNNESALTSNQISKILDLNEATVTFIVQNAEHFMSSLKDLKNIDENNIKLAQQILDETQESSLKNEYIETLQSVFAEEMKSQNRKLILEKVQFMIKSVNSESDFKDEIKKIKEAL